MLLSASVESSLLVNDILPYTEMFVNHSITKLYLSLSANDSPVVRRIFSAFKPIQ